MRKNRDRGNDDMPRPKKDSVPISILMERKLAEQLNEYCKETFLTKTAAIEKALHEMFQREMEKRQG